MKTSIEIQEFKKHFERRTRIKVAGVKENKEFFHWKRLVLNDLDGSEIIRVGEYIINYFRGNGFLCEFNGDLTLTVDKEHIEKYIQ